MFTKLQSRRQQRQQVAGNRQMLDNLARDWKKASSIEPANILTHEDEDCPVVDSDSEKSEGENRDADGSPTSSVSGSGDFGTTEEGESHLTDMVRDLKPWPTVSEDWKAASSVEPANEFVALNQGYYQTSPTSPEKQEIDKDADATISRRLDDVASIYDAEGGVVLGSATDFASSEEEEC